MTDIDKLTRAADDLKAAIDAYPTAYARLHDQLRGQPGSGFGGNGGRGSSSPVESALGINGPGDGGIKGDQAARKLEAVAELTKSICKQAHLLALLVSAEVPRVPTDKERREVEKSNTPDDGCHHHAAAGLYELAEHTGTVGGNLSLPMALCSFCYREVYRKGVLPRGEVLELRQVTGKDPKERVA